MVRGVARLCFVVVICGKMLTMPGLPKEPAAVRIKMDDESRATDLP